MRTERKYKSLSEFYPYYLTEHSSSANRFLHATGSVLIILIIIFVCVFPHWWLLIFVPVAGYGFAWAGHFFIEKNKPATFTYPVWSAASDFIMLFHILTRQVNAKLQEAHEKMGTESKKKQ